MSRRVREEKVMWLVLVGFSVGTTEREEMGLWERISVSRFGRGARGGEG